MNFILYLSISESTLITDNYIIYVSNSKILLFLYHKKSEPQEAYFLLINLLKLFAVFNIFY